MSVLCCVRGARLLIVTFKYNKRDMISLYCMILINKKIQLLQTL